MNPPSAFLPPYEPVSRSPVRVTRFMQVTPDRVETEMGLDAYAHREEAPDSFESALVAAWMPVWDALLGLDEPDYALSATGGDAEVVDPEERLASREPLVVGKAVWREARMGDDRMMLAFIPRYDPKVAGDYAETMRAWEQTPLSRLPMRPYVPHRFVVAGNSAMAAARIGVMVRLLVDAA